MPAILSIAIVIAMILLLVRVARMERILTAGLGSSLMALSRNLEIIRSSIAPAHAVGKEDSLDTDEYGADRYDDAGNEDDPQTRAPFVVGEVLATLRDIRKDTRRLRKRTNKQLPAPTVRVQMPTTIVLEISVVARLVRDQDGRISFPVKIGEGGDAPIIPFDVTEDLSAPPKQLNGGMPIRWDAHGAICNDGYWFFHGLVLNVVGSLGVPQDELVARIKHKAIRHEKELMTILREIEDFERGTR